jgi:hypothetical protein
LIDECASTIIALDYLRVDLRQRRTRSRVRIGDRNFLDEILRREPSGSGSLCIDRRSSRATLGIGCPSDHGGTATLSSIAC